MGLDKPSAEQIFLWQKFYFKIVIQLIFLPSLSSRYVRDTHIRLENT